jgi:hypothetical protein
VTRDKRSEENRRYLEYVRSRAESYGTRERQMEEFLRRAGALEDVRPETEESEENKPE